MRSASAPAFHRHQARPLSGDHPLHPGPPGLTPGGIITQPAVVFAADPASLPPRERGWRLILAALAVFLLVPAVPQLRVLFPLEQTILLVGPAIAVCALLSWLKGGRAWLAITWVALAAWMLSRPLSGAGSYELLARGWAILLSSLFGVVSLVTERPSFLARALATVGLAFTLAAGVVLASSVAPARVQRTLADEIDRRVAASSAASIASREGEQWQRFAAEHPQIARLVEEGERRWREVPDYTLRLFPALLALESLAALALAWGLFHRISRTRIGAPLRPLREFRFGDQLVWGLLAGIAMAAVPGLEEMRGFGWNLVVFFGALYVLRGLGVLAWFIASKRLAVVVLVVLAVIFWPVFGIVSLGLGLGDTWLDWRGRVRHLTS